MLLLPFFALFLGANSKLNYNQKARYPKGTVLRGHSSADLQYVVVRCKAPSYSSPNQKFQIKIWFDDEQENGWQTQLKKLQIII